MRKNKSYSYAVLSYVFIIVLVMGMSLCFYFGRESGKYLSYDNGYKDGALFVINSDRKSVGLPPFKNWNELKEYLKKKSEEKPKNDEDDDSIGPKDKYSNPFVMLP